MGQITYNVGEAPWETGSTSTSQSFPIGQAPWETEASKSNINNNTLDNSQTPQTGAVTAGDTTNDGLFKSIIKDPIKTLLVKPAIRTAQAITGTIGALTGNEALQNNANQGQTFDVPILGKYYIEPQKKLGQGGATQILGDAAGTASYLLPAGRAEKAGSSLFKGNLLKAAGGSALAGAQFGALSGLSSGLHQDEPTFGNILENTLIGGGLGLAGGATLGAAGALASKAVKGALNSGIADFVKAKVGINSETKTADNLYNKLAETNSGILNLTKNQINNETRFAKDTPLFIAKEAPDVSWNISKDGRLDTTPVIDALEPKYHAEAQAFNMALKDSGQYASLDQLGKDAITKAKEQFKGSAQDDAISKIDKEILAYKKQYSSNLINHNGDTIVPIHIIDDIKSDLWGKTKFYQTPEAAIQSQTSYLMGNSAKNIIEKTVTDSPIKAWNNRLGDFATAIKILNQRNGIKVGAGAYSKTGARILGGIAGHTIGGVPGEIAGMVTADQLVKMASDPNVKSFVLKKLIQRMSKNGQQGIIDEAQKVMEQRALERGSRKLLPSPGQTVKGNINLPSPGILEGQSKINLNSGKVNTGVAATIAGGTALGIGLGNTSKNIDYSSGNSDTRLNATPNIIAGVDISSYATDPQHEVKVNKIYNSTKNLSTSTDIQNHIDKIAPQSPITGGMVKRIADEFKIDARLLLAIIQNDSSFGTKGIAVKTKNVGNVGNTGSATTTFKTWEEGLRATARTLAHHKVSD